MTRYETLILAVPHITSDEARELEKVYEDNVKKHNGSILSFERWGKYRLAYPVSKNDYGVYYLARTEFDTPDKAAFDALSNLLALKFGNVVMRFMTTALKPGQSLEYQRPESLEDIPTRDVGQFLRDNKMGGLLSSVEGKDKKGAVHTDTDVTDMDSEEEIDG